MNEVVVKLNRSLSVTNLFDSITSGTVIIIIYIFI